MRSYNLPYFLCVTIALLAGLQNIPFCNYGPCTALASRKMMNLPSELAEEVSRTLLVSKKHEDSHCDLCTYFVSTVQRLAILNMDLAMAFSEVFCRTAHLQTAEVCSGAIERFGPVVLTALYNRTINPDWTCQSLGLCQGSDHPPAISMQERSPSSPMQLLLDQPAELPKSPPPPAQPEETEGPQTGHYSYFLQIADIHFDPNYREGADIQCDTPLCCQSSDYPAPSAERRAGRVGELLCDTSEALLDGALHFASHSLPPLDFVLFTGDVPAHTVWRDTASSTSSALSLVYSKLLQAFPPPLTRVYPVLGNHGCVPADQLPLSPGLGPVPPAPLSLPSLLTLLWELWEPWLPASCRSTVLQGGFYTLLHRPGLRVVALNTQWLDSNNFWLQATCQRDPGGQLAWLESVLTGARQAGEQVILTGHIPLGDKSAFSALTEQYLAVLQRFEASLAAQISGHTHKDHFKLQWDVGGQGPVRGVTLMARSLTPYKHQNPGLRLYALTPASPLRPATLADYFQYQLDLGEANAVGHARGWRLSYRARARLGLQDLSPGQYASLVGRLQANQSLWQTFWQGMGQVHPPPCQGQCRQDTLCYLNSTTFASFQQCTGGKGAFSLPNLLDSWLCQD